MALTDLSLVTETLTRLLKRYIQITHPLMFTSLTVTGAPSDLLDEVLTSETPFNALSVYLYYLEEDGHSKNLPAPPGNSPPVQFQEMGLSLYYLLTVKSITPDSSLRSIYEQRLMGYALKALHDYPFIDENTQIGTGTESYAFPSILRENGNHNEFHLALHPANLDELNKVWTGISSPMRLSAVYQVSVVMLKAEEPTASPIPVLTPQIEVRPFQSIWIQATESDYRFTLPGQTIERLAISPTASVPVGGAFRVLGFGFAGVGTRVFLQSPFWSEPSYIDITDWITVLHGDQRMELQVASLASGRNIVPGPYQIYIQKGQDISNFSSVNIAPVIGRDNAEGEPLPDIVPATGSVSTSFEIYGGPFAGDDIRSVEVFFGVTRLTNVTPGEEVVTPLPELGPGEFRVIPGATNRIEASVPNISVSDISDIRTYSLRVVVNGISTPPSRWFEVTP